jgi:hypothetical protein
MVRPLIQKGIGELEELVARSGVDPNMVKDVIDELRHRSTPRAKRLLAELEAGPKTAAVAGVGTGPRARRANASRSALPSSGRPEAMGEVGPLPRSLLEAYEVLRETFTEDSELLARWGLTSALPVEMRNTVLEEWARRVGVSPDEFGRTTEQLRVDVERLRANEESRKDQK